MDGGEEKYTYPSKSPSLAKNMDKSKFHGKYLYTTLDESVSWNGFVLSPPGHPTHPPNGAPLKIWRHQKAL